MDYSNLFVCLLGMGIVFLGLIILIALVSVMSNVVNATDKKAVAPAPAVSAAPVAAAPAAAAAVTPAMVAAISAAIAEASGTDAAALRIVSIKQI